MRWTVEANRQWVDTDRQTDRQINGQTKKQRLRQTDRCTILDSSNFWYPYLFHIFEGPWSASQTIDLCHSTAALLKFD